MPDVIKHTIACPSCRDAGISTMNPVMTRHGNSKYFCDKGHEFADTEELMARQPGNLPFTPPKPKPLMGAVKFAVNIEPEVLGILQARYQDKLDSAARFFLRALAQEDSFVVDSASANQLKTHFGVKPDSAQKLIGMVWSLKKDVEIAQEELKVAKEGGAGQRGAAPSGMGLEFDADVLVTLQAKAKEKKLSLRSFLEQVITGALANEWI